MNYKETTEFLFNSLPEFQYIGSEAYKPGLERTEDFNAYLGHPDKKFKSIHIAGTNGKGSTSHIIASALRYSGHKTGLYTSPHLTDFRERIKIDGVQISEQQVIDFVEQHKQKMLELRLSFFEMTVAMAFDHFARNGVEMAVIEVGLGGRLDSTNIITPELCIITNIGLDHMALLGDTIEKIAAEKAGIIKRDVPVIIGEHGDGDNVFIDKAAVVGAPITFAQDIFRVTEQGTELDLQHFVVEPFGSVQLDLLGDYQKRNVVTAIAALTSLGIAHDDIVEGCRVAARSTGLMGRWQIVGRRPLMVCDTGHNSHGIAYVARQIEATAHKRLIIVVGFVNDKELGSVFELLPRNAHYIFTQAAIYRALDAEQLQKNAKMFNLFGEYIPSVSKAVLRAQSIANKEDMIFIGGSTFVVSEALAFIQN